MVICAPSTSASVAIIILWYLNFEISNSSAMAAPKAITQGFYFFESQHFVYGRSSTFKILPFSGRIACVLLSRPCLPGTAGRISLNNEYLRFAGIASLAVGQFARQSQPFQNAFSQYAFLSGFGGFSGFKRQQNLGNYGSGVARIFFQEKANASPKTDSTAVLASGLPSLALVCPSN